jgi:hypothetical protein
MLHLATIPLVAFVASLSGATPHAFTAAALPPGDRLSARQSPDAPSVDGIGPFVDLVRKEHERQVAILRPGTTVPWFTSDGRTLQLVEWRGKSISLLTERSDLEPTIVKRFLDTLDAYWLRCREICGNTPPPDAEKGPLVQGRAIIAEAVRPAPETPLGPIPKRKVPIVATPGIARVSIGTEALEETLTGLANRTPSAPLGSALPVAIARTFVFFESELGAAAPEQFEPLASALAFLLAGEVQDSLGWTVPVDPRPFDEILAAYSAGPTATYASTLAKGRGIAGPTADTRPGWDDAESLWIALLLNFRHASGEREFMRRVWTTLYECPPAPDRAIALGNLVVAVSAGAKSNLVSAFRALRFDVDQTTAGRVAEALAPRKLDVGRKKPARSAPRT